MRAIRDEHGNVLSPTELGMPEGHPTRTEVRVEAFDKLGHRLGLPGRVVGDGPREFGPLGFSDWRFANKRWPARRIRS